MATATFSDRRTELASLAAERGRGGSSGRFWKRAGIALVILALLSLLVLWFLGFLSAPPEVAAVRKLVDEQVAQLERVGRGEVPLDQVAGFGAIMGQMRDMPREQRDRMRQEMGRLWEARERAETASYFALPPEKRQAELDRRIKAEEDRRKQSQAERERRDQQGGDRRTAANGGDARGGARDGGGGGPGGRRGGGTEDSRNDRTKRMIDRSTPEQRAQRSEYRRTMEERRTQLGIAPGRRG
jgi:uncharacterized membrane protein YgcG